MKALSFMRRVHNRPNAVRHVIRGAAMGVGGCWRRAFANAENAAGVKTAYARRPLADGSLRTDDP